MKTIQKLIDTLAEKFEEFAELYRNSPEFFHSDSKKIHDELYTALRKVGAFRHGKTNDFGQMCAGYCVDHDFNLEGCERDLEIAIDAIEDAIKFVKSMSEGEE